MFMAVKSTTGSSSITSINIEEYSTKWNSTWLEQFQILSYRAFKNRQGHMIDMTKTFEILAISIIAGIIWFRIERTEANLDDWVAATFFFEIYLSFTTMFRGIVTFPEEKSVVIRERQSGAYRLSAYYLSKIVFEFPVDIIHPFLALTIFYWLAGLEDNVVIFIQYLLISFLAMATSSAFGTWLGCALPFDKALTMLAVIGLLMMLISGFLVKDRAIPIFISWVRYISFMRYGYLGSVMVLLQNGGVEFKCDQNSEYEECNNSSTSKIDGKMISKQYGIQENMNMAIFLLLGGLILWNTLAYLYLKKNTATKSERNQKIDQECGPNAWKWFRKNVLCC